MHAIKRTLDFIGDVIPFTARNGVRINLHWIREGVYRVEVLAAGPVARLVEDLTGSYAHEQDARDAAFGIAVVNNAEADGTDAAELLRVEVADKIAEAMRRRDTRRVAALNKLADKFETASERALVADVRQHLDAVHNGKPPLPARSFRELRDRHQAGLARDRKPAA